MDVITLDGNPGIAVHLRRNARAKRLTLRVSQIDGAVTLTLPKRASLRLARQFLSEKSVWIEEVVARQAEGVQVGLGVKMPLAGQPVRLSEGPGKRILQDGSHLFVPGKPEQVARKTAAWLKALARERLADASDRYATTLGEQFSAITLRDTRSRWGSCTTDGRLMYSWRLIMAPPDVLEYVAAHEVAHLREMNHSADFWALVENLFPGYKIERKWLREHGAELHRYRF